VGPPSILHFVGVPKPNDIFPAATRRSIILNNFHPVRFPFFFSFAQTIQKHNKKNLTRRKNAHTQTNKQKRATLKLMCVFVAHTTFLFDDKYINTQAFPEFGYIRNYYVTWFERYVGAMKLVCDKIITCIRVCLDLDLDFLFQTLTYVSINFLHIYVCRRKHIDLLCCGRSI
jgi:hypothetical protein